MIGIDGNEGGRDAIALGRLLVSHEGRMTLAYVHHGAPLLARASSHQFDSEENERALELLQRERDQSGLAHADLHTIGASSVGRGLHELASIVAADLLVVGSTRRSLVGRVLVGDDTVGALNGAPCAVAVAPAGYVQHPKAMREVGVGYNESAESEHAIKVARTIAAEHGAIVSAFEAVALPAYAFYGVPNPTEEAIEGLVAEALERISSLGDITPHAVYGRPSEELTLYSASIDLLVLGSRDYGPVGRLMHGSTTNALTRSARCPLLVLTRAVRAAEVEERSEADDRDRSGAGAGIG
jgi:nucleotide-binding universal stress UspA family protein